ncbi:excalibur calcium-binding domain-containing protein, partial [Neobacillus drentensis]|uniref:excalibur calcium-binding domain-containing protein n=1 Tax=Neobacillus drentensis TaxID=220684 RepID=UPI002FFE0676
KAEAEAKAKAEAEAKEKAEAEAKAASSGGSEFFANCTELRKKYPNGVPSDHPAYQPKMDRDNDNFACER